MKYHYQTSFGIEPTPAFCSITIIQKLVATPHITLALCLSSKDELILTR